MESPTSKSGLTKALNPTDASEVFSLESFQTVALPITYAGSFLPDIAAK
jgi:hypothetical protein